MSLDPALTARLSAWLAATDIAILELRGPDGALRLVRAGPEVRREPFGPAENGGGPEAATVTAPGVGVFLDRHPLRLEPAARPGTPYGAGEPLGFLRIGPILRAIPAPCDCLVQDVMAAHGTTVGFGAPLIAIVPLAAEVTP